MNTRNTPILTYYISDAYGKRNVDPRTAAWDVDALLETDLSDLADILENGDPGEIDRFQERKHYNLHGRAIAVGQHIALIMHDWTKQYAELLKRHGVFVGLFINDAARSQASGGSAPEFHTIEPENPLRIVVSPVEAAATIAPDARAVEVTPNVDNNGLWRNGSQFRSKNAPRLLRRGHKYAANTVDSSVINNSDVLRTLRYRYGDTYGNMVGYGGETGELAKKLVLLSRQDSRRILIKVADVQHEGEAASSLEQANPGAIIAYPNGGSADKPNIDVTRKWAPGDHQSGKSVEASGVGAFSFERGVLPIEGKAEISIEFIDQPDGGSRIVAPADTTFSSATTDSQ